MRILHLVPGLEHAANGIAVAARMIAAEQGADIVDCKDVGQDLSAYDEAWVHSMWTPQVWKACWRVQKSGVRLVRMTHACLDPLRVAYHGGRKWLVSPIERRLFARCDRVVVTGAWEQDWCEAWGLKGPFELLDLKRFFTFAPVTEHVQVRGENRPLHLLFLGRRHPLKGLECLEAAVSRLKDFPLELRIVRDAFGDEKEKVWDWCDVLVLPTLSENFGLVVAEALVRGKRVITTDGAPAWEDQPGVVYLRGFRDGTDARRVELLEQALGAFVRSEAK